MSVETYVKETKNAFMEGCRGYGSRGIFAVSIASRMSVLSFCSEKQNGWLVTGKTPVLLLVGNVSTPNRSDRLASETPEQRQIRLQSMSASNAVRLASETPEQRQIRLQSMSASNAVRLASETPEQRQIRLQSMSARNAVRVALIQRKIILRHKRSSELHEHYNYVYSSENILLF